MSTSVTFNELTTKNETKYEKKKKIPFSELDDDELEERFENNTHKSNYKKQFGENLDYTKKQINAVKDEMDTSQWNKLDNADGPLTNYDHPL